LKKESETTKKQQAIAAKKADLLKEYPDTVRQLAEDLDVDLTDPDDEKAIEIFTTKLDKIKDRVDAEGGSGEETSPKPKSKPKVGSDNSNLETREQRQKTETEDMAELTKRVENITF
jgi:hypothetical protein